MTLDSFPDDPPDERLSDSNAANAPQPDPRVAAVWDMLIEALNREAALRIMLATRAAQTS